MILVEWIIKIMEFGTDILLKMGFQKNVLTTGIFEMALKSKMTAICTGSNKPQISFFDGIEENSWFWFLQYNFQLGKKVLELTFHCD